MKQPDQSQQSCDQIDFRVAANSGTFTLTECEKSTSGQIKAEEFLKLDSLATKAYQQTDGTVCPQIFRFNEFYAAINSSDDELDRNFDPDSSCYVGKESVVRSFKSYLRQLIDRYRIRPETETLSR